MMFIDIFDTYIRISTPLVTGNNHIENDNKIIRTFSLSPCFEGMSFTLHRSDYY